MKIYVIEGTSGWDKAIRPIRFCLTKEIAEKHFRDLFKQKDQLGYSGFFIHEVNVEVE